MATSEDFDEQLEQQRKRYFEARAVLTERLGEGIDDELIGYSKYAGIAEALAEFYNDPEHFGFSGQLDVTDLEGIKPVLTRAYSAEIEMMRIVNEREAALCSADPTRLRQRIHLGREYVMDRTNTQMRFLDTDETYEQSRTNTRSI